MALLKYIIFGLLALSAWEADNLRLLIPEIRVSLVGLYLAYAAYALWLFKRPTSDAYRMGNVGKMGPLRFAKLASTTIYLLLFRIVFALCALALMAQALAIWDPSMVVPPGPQEFLSFFVMTIEHFYFPLSIVRELVGTDIRPAALNQANSLTFVLRLLSYLMASVLVVSVLKELAKLAWRGEHREIEERVHYANTRAPQNRTTPTSPAQS